MKQLLFCLTLILSYIGVSAQQASKDYKYQELTDPSYIYFLEDVDYKPVVREVSPYYGTAVLFKGQLYKHVSLSRFYVDSGLIEYRGRHYHNSDKIARYTADARIDDLYVVGKPYSDKKIMRIREWQKKFPRRK